MAGPAPSSRTSQPIRDLSKLAFNSAYRIEVALAISELDEVFTFEELYERLAAIVEASDVAECVSPAKARNELATLRSMGALERLPKAKGELLRRERRCDSALWELAQELRDRC